MSIDRSLLRIAVLALVCASSAAAQNSLKINEVFTGVVDFLELRNCSATTADLSGWTLSTWVATAPGAAPLAESSFTFPAGTTLSGGALLLLEEGGTAGMPGGLPSSMSVGQSYLWTSAVTLEIALVDAGGVGRDYLYRNAHGNGIHPHLPAGTQWTGELTSTAGDLIRRIQDADTDDAADWSVSFASPTYASLNPGQSGTQCSGPLLYQLNQPAASVDFDGVTSGGLGPARQTITTCSLTTLRIQSTVAPTAYEIVVNSGAVQPLGAPGTIQLPQSGQIVNLDLADPTTFFFNGVTQPAFQPFTTSLVFSLTIGTPRTISLQGVLVDPSNPNGVALSQANELVVLGTTTIPGPTSLDGSVLVDLSALCGSVSFFGTNYTQVGVNANGRLSFGQGSQDFSATKSEASQQLPFVGFWCDHDVTASGSITISSSSNTFAVDYVAVPYAGEPTSQNSYRIGIDLVNGDLVLSGLSGIQANPGTVIGAGDSMFLGLSPGSRATGGVAVDPGATLFVNGTSGIAASADEMIYDFFDHLGAAAGVPFLCPSLGPGTLNEIRFSPGANGAFAWSAN